MSVEVTQADRDAALQIGDELYEHWDNFMRPKIERGDADSEPIVQLLAAHRRQAEEAMRERAAAYIEGKGDVIPGATVFIPLITGDRMPCMSGDGRDKLNPHKRRQFDDATRDLAAAIRSIDTRGE